MQPLSSEDLICAFMDSFEAAYRQHGKAAFAAVPTLTALAVASSGVASHGVGSPDARKGKCAARAEAGPSGVAARDDGGPGRCADSTQHRTISPGGTIAHGSSLSAVNTGNNTVNTGVQVTSSAKHRMANLSPTNVLENQ